jgi:Cas6b C-terminal domain/Cas6b N-terminal domain
MKKLRILAVSFDTHIQPYQLSAFRGAVASKVGWEHDWFHNHDNSTEGGGKTINRYPLIQYKLDTRGEQMRPMLLCLDEAIEEAHHFFSQSDWTVDLKSQQHNLKIAHLRVNQYTLNVWQRPFSYRLHKWLALNTENYQKYQTFRGVVDKLSFLEKLLRTQILSFAKGVDWDLTDDFNLKILNLPRENWLEYKHKQKVLAFTLDFECDLSLPDFIGLGRGASRGLGVVRSAASHVRNTEGG